MKIFLKLKLFSIKFSTSRLALSVRSSVTLFSTPEWSNEPNTPECRPERYIRKWCLFELFSRLRSRFLEVKKWCGRTHNGRTEGHLTKCPNFRTFPRCYSLFFRVHFRLPGLREAAFSGSPRKSPIPIRIPRFLVIFPRPAVVHIRIAPLLPPNSQSQFILQYLCATEKFC